MKRLFLILSIFAMLSSVVLAVNAHSGRTDSSGGHTDNSTGEYHYHHGYPAHDHYDMDGDGDLDCPYEFDDNTNHGSNNSNGSDHKIDIDISTLPTIPQVDFDFETIPIIDFPTVPDIESELYTGPLVNGLDSKEKDAPSKDMTFGDFVGTMLECILLSIAIGMAASHLLSYIFLSISKEKGCSITIVSFIVISIVAFIWLLYSHLCCG